MKQDKVIELATYKLLHCKWKKASCLDQPNKPWHPDIKWAWGRMSTYERAWYILYTMAEFYLDDAALSAICPDVILYDKVYADLVERSNVHRRSLTNLSQTQQKKRDQDNERRNAEKRQSDERRSSRYTARDVPWDMAIFDPETDQSPVKVAITTPIYEGHRNGPIRRLTAAQYEAEKGPLSARKRV